MKVYNTVKSKTLHKDLQKKLNEIRSSSRFNAKKYVESKVKLLNNYLTHFGLKSCVVGVSGGIDSAVVLALIHKASKKKDSPIKKIVPVLMPALNSDGVTGQWEATQRGLNLCKSLRLVPETVDLTELSVQLRRSCMAPNDRWADGQMVANLRTPTLYYYSSLLTQKFLPGIVVGTTNKTEGSYLGYVGKASDGMVDIQLISDLFKSQVYAVAKELKITKEIINVIPTGDMFDGRVDEEVFGASYDFAELYLHLLGMYQKEYPLLSVIGNISKAAKNQFVEMAANLEKLHKYNQHKYLGRSPAVHLDLFYNQIPGEWGVATKEWDKLRSELLYK